MNLKKYNYRDYTSHNTKLSYIMTNRRKFGCKRIMTAKNIYEILCSMYEKKITTKNVIQHKELLKDRENAEQFC